MELCRYAPHMNREKLKVNKFLFVLTSTFVAKVNIPIPKTLHDATQ
jgi:hypothetical protein